MAAEATLLVMEFMCILQETSDCTEMQATHAKWKDSEERREKIKKKKETKNAE